MEKIKRRNIIIIAAVITFAMLIICITAIVAAKNTEYTPSGWVIRSYGNGVALYNGSEVDSVYEEIVLDALPPDDVNILNSGIAFPTREEAIRALEDYDG